MYFLGHLKTPICEWNPKKEKVLPQDQADVKTLPPLGFRDPRFNNASSVSSRGLYMILKGNHSTGAGAVAQW